MEPREVQPLKALLPMEVTEDGILTEAREEQRSKAYAPIVVTELGMMTEESEEHPRKAESLIEGMSSGRATLRNEVNPWKLQPSIKVDPFSKVRLTRLSFSGRRADENNDVCIPSSMLGITSSVGLPSTPKITAVWLPSISETA